MFKNKTSSAQWLCFPHVIENVSIKVFSVEKTLGNRQFMSDVILIEDTDVHFMNCLGNAQTPLNTYISEF